MKSCHVAVIGAGIAGASIAACLSQTCSVTLLEMEERPGYHSTGRSAAVFLPFYGNDVVRALTAASDRFFKCLPQGFSEQALIRPRRALIVARKDQEQSLAKFLQENAAKTAHERVTAKQAAKLCPILDDRKFEAAILLPDCADIDVNGLHAGFIRRMREHGGALRTSSQVTALRRGGSKWLLKIGDEEISADLVVNAAGAWAAHVAELAGARDVKLVPMRRSAALVQPPEGAMISDWPGIIDVDEQFYVKPESGHLMISPADETPVEPHDAQPNELDIAIAVDRVQSITTLNIARLHYKWAGLRSFVADRSPVIGFDPDVHAFFWAAALGGFGIQTAPAVGEIAAEIVRGADPSSAFARIGVRWDAIGPARNGVSSGDAIAAADVTHRTLV